MEIVIWSKEWCGYCDKAKALFKSKELPYEERKIGDGWTKEDLLKVVPDAKSVPQIFIDGKLIGGYDDLVKHWKPSDE